MTILRPSPAVAFVAFCVWLTVRIVNRRELWAKWTAAIVLGLPVLYIVSLGPANWLYIRQYRIEGHRPWARRARRSCLRGLVCCTRWLEPNLGEIAVERRIDPPDPLLQGRVRRQ